MSEQETLEKYTKNGVIERPDLITSLVVEIEVVLAKEQFKEKAKNPESYLLKVTTHNESLSYTDNFFMTKFPADNVPENSKLGKFLKRYGVLEVGMQVKMIKNGDFYDVQI